jgi:hypothetical protein
MPIRWATKAKPQIAAIRRSRKSSLKVRGFMSVGSTIAIRLRQCKLPGYKEESSSE